MIYFLYNRICMPIKNNLCIQTYICNANFRKSFRLELFLTIYNSSEESVWVQSQCQDDKTNRSLLEANNITTGLAFMFFVLGRTLVQALNSLLLHARSKSVLETFIDCLIVRSHFFLKKKNKATFILCLYNIR